MTVQKNHFPSRYRLIVIDEAHGSYSSATELVNRLSEEAQNTTKFNSTKTDSTKGNHDKKERKL